MTIESKNIKISKLLGIKTTFFGDYGNLAWAEFMPALASLGFFCKISTPELGNSPNLAWLKFSLRENDIFQNYI